MLSKLLQRSTPGTTTPARQRGLFVERLEPRTLLTASGLYTLNDQHDTRLLESDSHFQRMGPMVGFGRFDSRDGNLFAAEAAGSGGSGWLVRGTGQFEGGAPNRGPAVVIEFRIQPIMPEGGEMGGRGLPPMSTIATLPYQIRSELVGELPFHEPSSLVAGIETVAANRPNGLGAISSGLNGNGLPAASRIDGGDLSNHFVAASHNTPLSGSGATELTSNDSAWVDSWTREEAERLRLKSEESSDEGGYVGLETSINADVPWAAQAMRSVASKEKSSTPARFSEDGSLRRAAKSEQIESAHLRSRKIPSATALSAGRAADDIFGDEGGMIEMMADASSYAPASTPVLNAAGNAPISIDRAIGLFQAVELASSPDDILLPLAPSQPQESPKLPAAPEPATHAEQAAAPESELSSIPLSRAAGVPVIAGAFFSLLSTTSSRHEVKQLRRKPR